MSKKKRVFIIGSTLFLLVGAFLYLQPIKVGAVSVFTSGQLAPSAVNGYILSTNGTANSWIANTSSPFPFTPFTSYNGTSTPIGFSAGLFTNGSTTITSVGTGFVQAINGLLSAAALTAGQITTALGFTPPPNTRNLTVAGTDNQIISSAGAQDLSADRTWTLSFANHTIFPSGGYESAIGSTTNATTTSNQYVGTFLGVGTTTPSQSSLLGVNGNGFFNGTVYASNFYDTALSGTNCVSETNGLLGTSNCVSSIASANDKIVVSSPTGGVTLTYTGLATTTNLTQGQLLYNTTGGNGVASVATSSVTINAPLSGTIVGVGTGLSLSCTTASAGVAGCLNSTDWSVFNNKISSSSLSATFPLSYNSSTGAFISSFSTTTDTGLSAGNLYIGSGGIMQTSASSSIFGYTPLNPTRSLTFSSGNGQIVFSAGAQDLSADRTWTATYTGLATTSQPASSNLLVSNGGAGVYGEATTSASCSGTVSCTAFTVLGSSPITITGSASGGSFPFTATTNFGGVVYATSTPSLWFQAGTYASSTSYMDNLQLGSSTITSIFPNNPLYIGGQQNNYIQQVIQNRSNGNNASGVLSIHDDRGTDTTYYTEFGINSSGYSQATFASQNAGDSFLNVSDGALVIGTASTTNSLADLRFTTGGTASSSIRMIIRQGGLIGIGTTTPVLGALTIATTTAPQLVLSAGAGLSSWTTRNSFGTLYFATTSITAPNATSTVSALSINTNGVVNFAIPPTLTGRTNSGTGGFAFVTSPTIATPTFTTSAVSPILIGGSAVSQTLILRSTSGVGTSDALIFQTGNSVERARFNTFGNLGIGTTTPSGFAKVTISTSSPQLLLTDGTATSIPWNVRSFGGSLFFATSSPSTFATSSISAISVDTNGALTVNNLGTGIIMATLGKLQQLILSASFTLTGSTLTSNHWQSFTYATSTAWTGTTTVPLEVGYGETINNVRCFTDVGTVDADFYTGNFTSGNKHLNYLRQASTTIGTTTMSTNNSFQYGTTTSVNLGTPASSPTKVTCTVSKTL